MTAIHVTAIVDPGAELDGSVSVGPYTIIGPHVKVGAGTTIGPHCVIDTAGTEKTNRQTVRIAANGGKIAIIAGHFAVPVPFMIGKELQVFGIRGGGPENVELAIRLLQEKRIDLRSTITTHFDFKDIGEAFRQFYENKENVVKIMLRN